MQSASSDGVERVVAVESVRAIDPAAGLDAVVDVVVEAGRVTRIGAGAAADEIREAEGALRIDGRGKWLLPAFVELHAHLREPGQEHKEDIASGLTAAGRGGYAHVCAMPNTRPVNDCLAVTEKMVARAAAVGGARLHPIAAVTLGLEGVELTDMEALRAGGAVAFSDDGRCVLADEVMRSAFVRARRLDVPIIQHCEDHRLTEGAVMHEGARARRAGLRGWPREAEDGIIARDLALLEAVGGRYHVAHLSTAGVVELVRRAKERGLAVTAEVTPHHLLLTDEAIGELGPLAKVNPPLREPEDVAAVLAGLCDGTIDAIATDHAPHTMEEKQRALPLAPPGMAGLELVVPALLGLLDRTALRLERFVDALTRAPASVIGIDAPRIREGDRAALCMIDASWQGPIDASGWRSKGRNSPLIGRPGQGRVMLTIADGRIVHWER